MNHILRHFSAGLFFSFLAFVPLSAHASGQTAASADSLYQAQDYQGAAQVYSRQLQEQGANAATYYNLGNCYYKMDDIPHSILCYERAAILDPSDADTRANLLLARSKTVDKVVPPSEMFFVTWWRTFTHYASMDEWAVIAVSAFVLMLLGWLAYFFAPEMKWRKTGFYLAVAFLLTSLLSNGCVLTQYRTHVYRNSAVVLVSAVTVKSAPSESSTDLFVMHGGARVEILDRTMKQWREVKLEEGKQGWVLASALETI